MTHTGSPALPLFVLHLPSHSEGKAAQLVGQQGKVSFFIFNGFYLCMNLKYY